MSEIDVRQLAEESLTAGSFPASRTAAFRVHFDREVHAAIQRHAREDTSIEICGVLVGDWQRDDDGPFALIRSFIRCDSAASKNAEVTFTHESWAQINSEMDSKYADQRIIGWYHSHPDFGIFLSDRDMFIQEHFFCGPGQIAYVVDPVRELEGVFEWRSGRAEVMECYWVGDRVVTSAASRSAEGPRRPGAEYAAEPDHAAPAYETAAADFSGSRGTSRAPSTMIMLAWLCVFLLGYLLNGLTSDWERRYVMEGVVAHYGLWNILQIGRAELVTDTRRRLELAFDSVSELSNEHARLLKGDEQTKIRKRWKNIRTQLARARDTLRTVEEKYSVPEEQRALLAEVVVDRLVSLTRADTRRSKLPVPVPLELMELMKPVLQPPGQSAPSGTVPAGKSSGRTSPSSRADSGSSRTSDRSSRSTRQRPAAGPRPAPGTNPPPGPDRDEKPAGPAASRP